MIFLFLISFALAQDSEVNREIEAAFGNIESIRDTESVDLDDVNFEHLTQASTGATTGDWFINFYKSDCNACTVFEPSWLFLSQKVSKASDLQVTIAKVNGEKSPELLKRFKISQFPTLIYFRLGSMYDITGPRDVDYLYEVVAEHKYKEYPKQPVPKELNIFDSISLYNFWTLPFYIHCIWILSLTAFIAFLIPNKQKTN